MKTKYYLMTVAAALALAACAKQEQTVQPEEATAEMAVGFDAYTSRGVDTKAGPAGELTTSGFKVSPSAFKDAGFGVFAYYTDNNDYDSNSVPNFMYNQQVKWNGNSTSGKWEYSPVKYWPNEYGSNAISDDRDKVSFFAYAPWVAVVPSTGKIDGTVDLTTWGITGVTRNTITGDPLVKYMVSFDPTKSVDLVWGVVPAASTTWNTIYDGDTEQTMVAGKPWANVERPATTAQTLKFDFNHALSKLNVQIDAFVDGTDATNALATETRIFVRSITFSGFAIKGALNLNNQSANTAYWKDYAGVDDLMTGEEVTIFDGRKDGKEGASDATASNEKILGLNPVIISDNGNTQVGVTNAAVNLFDSATATTPVYVIPTGDPVKVTIVYDVETEDSSLATYLSDGKTFGSSIQNTISKNVTFGTSNKFENGKAYTLKLHLGMNSVKLEAEVTTWVPETASDTDLPANS